MKLTRIVIVLWALSLPATTFSRETGQVAPPPHPLPKPVLVFTGGEEYQANGKQWRRYNYAVDNSADYPNLLFAAAPELPPCGLNTKAARTWIDFYTQDGKRLNGFCALTNHDGLNRIWFALESEIIPPSWIYIEMIDRGTGIRYKSGLVETTL